MGTYSFNDVNATINGPGGNFNLASGAGAAKEGITVAPVGDKNTMVVGADGQGQHNLMADDSSKVTVRLLKTSPVNALLQAMFNFQSLSSANWGQNNITITNPTSGDLIDLGSVAFKKRPEIGYATEGATVEWEFDAIVTSMILGNNG